MPKQITGTVSSTKQDKTIVIISHTRKTHPLYKKQYPVTKKFMAHDPKNEAKVGDQVIITETRPISARKHFILTKITSKTLLEEQALSAIKSDDTNQKASKKAEPKEKEK